MNNVSLDDEKITEAWRQISDKVSIGKEEFLRRVHELHERVKRSIPLEAAAYIVAKELRIEMPALLPTVRGRILESGTIRKSKRDQTPYCLFTLVNEKERILGVAFGEEKIREIKRLDDVPVEITNFSLVRTKPKESMVRITSSTTIKRLDDKAMPPIEEMKAAMAGSLGEMMKSGRTFVVSALVADEESREYQACPECSRAANYVSPDWICQVHGKIEPRKSVINHLKLADKSGMYPAVYFGELHEGLFKKMVTLKGFMLEGELQIGKIYQAREV